MEKLNEQTRKELANFYIPKNSNLKITIKNGTKSYKEKEHIIQETHIPKDNATVENDYEELLKEIISNQREIIKLQKNPQKITVEHNDNKSNKIFNIIIICLIVIIAIIWIIYGLDTIVG